MPRAVTKKEKKKEADAKRDAKQEQWDTQRRVNANLPLHILCPKAYIILQGLCKWVSDTNAVRRTLQARNKMGHVSEQLSIHLSAH